MSAGSVSGLFGGVSAVFAVVALACPDPALAATVRGRVTNAESGASLPYAPVSLKGRALGLATIVEMQAMTDASGRYVLEDVSPGRFALRVELPGFEAFVDSVSVRLGEDVDRDIALSPEAERTETVVVLGDRSARERSRQPALVQLDADQLQSAPSIGDPDPIRSLQLLPGVLAASDISSGLYIRGGGPDQTLVLLDGVTVYNPTHAFGFFSTFNTDAIDGVALYKGAYPAAYGGRLGSVVDVASRTPETTELGGKGSLSTLSARLTLEGPAGSNGWSVSGRRTYLEPILSSLRKSTPEIPFYSFYDLNAKFVTNPAARGWAEVVAYRGRDDLRIEPDRDTRLSIDWGNTVVLARYNQAWGPDFLGTIALSFSEYESITDANVFNTPVGITNRLRDLSGRAQLDVRAGKHATTWGVAASVYDFRFKQSFNRDDPVGFDTKPVELTTYVDDRWDVRGGTSIRTGVRTRWVSDGDRWLIEPRLAVSQALPNDLLLKLGGGIYHQYLQLVSTEGFSAGDLYVPVDDTTSPGRSVQGVAGLEWNPSPTYQISAEGYYTDLSDLAEWDDRATADQESFTAEDLFVTQGSGYATGLELFAQRRTGRVTGWVGYALGWSRRTFDELNAGESFAPKYDRRHDFKAVLSYRSGPWSYSTAFVFGTGQAFTPASARYRVEDPALGSQTEGALVLPARRNSGRLLPYHRLDFSVTRDFTAFGRPASWYVQFFNLYTRRNEWFVQFDDRSPDVEVFRMLPIVPSVGLSFSF